MKAERIIPRTFLWSKYTPAQVRALTRFENGDPIDHQDFAVLRISAKTKAVSPKSKLRKKCLFKGVNDINR